jgi:hypothetical protein
MRLLEDIFDSSEMTSREILFEEGLWCLYRKESDLDPINVIHRCANVRWAIDMSRDTEWACGNNETDGSGCGEIAPDKLKGLYMMYMWER